MLRTGRGSDKATRVRKHRKLMVESLEERQLLSGLGFTWETPLAYGAAGAISGNIIPGTINLLNAPDVSQLASINPYQPPREVEAWIDGTTVNYRANVDGVWESGSTTYAADQVVVDVQVCEGVVAWTVGTALPNGQVVARRVGFAIYDTNQDAWVTGQSANLGVNAVAQLVNQHGFVVWSVGYPTSSGFVPREVGAAVYDADAAEGGWKVFQTNTSGNTRTIEQLLVNEGSIGWSIGQPSSGSEATPIKAVGMASYNFVSHEWVRHQVNARAQERFINVQNGGGAMFWLATYENRTPAGAPQEFYAAVFDDARGVWKSNRTNYGGKYQLGDFKMGDGVAAWTLYDNGQKVGVGLGAYDSTAGGIVFRAIPLASHQELDRVQARGQMIAWVVRDRSNPNNQQINLAFYDSGQRLWKIWNGPTVTNQRIGELQIDAWVGWTVQRQDSSGQWVDRSASVAVYDPGRGTWRVFQSPEATDRSVINFATHGPIAAWKIGYLQPGTNNYVARNVGAVSYDYLTGQFQYRPTTYDLGTFIEFTAVGNGVAAWSTGSNVSVLLYDPTSQNWQTATTTNPNTVRILELTTAGRLVAWRVGLPSGYDSSFVPREVGFAAYDTQTQSWVLGSESYPSGQVDSLYIADQFVNYSVNGTGYRRAYDAWTMTWGSDPPTPVSNILVAPTAVPVNRGITVLDWSMGASDQFVSFGDGWKFSRELQIHSYRVAGVYTLTQAVNGPGGQDDSSVVIAVVPARTPESLGTISSATLTDQEPVNGTLWYSLQVAADGAFTASVTGAGITSNTAMVLCSAAGDLYSLLGSGATSLGISSVTAGTTYYLMVSGLEGPVNVALDNPPTLSLTDRTVTIRGTANDDEAYLGYFNLPIAVVNGASLIFEPGTTGVLFDGRGGRDTVQLYGTDGAEHAVIGLMEGNRGGADVTGLGFQLSARNCEDITFVGAGGADIAEISDTPGSDLFTSQHGLAVMEGNGFRFAAVGVPIVHGYSRGGGNDRAQILGSIGKDTAVATRDWTRLTSADGSYFVRAKGFRTVEVEGGGGDDSMEFRDSPGKDILTVTPTRSEIVMPGRNVIATNFRQVVGQFMNPSQDEVFLSGTPGADTLMAGPRQATLQAGDFQAIINGASQITVFSRGGNDVATLTDSSGDDKLVALPRDVTLSGQGYQVRVIGYRNVVAEASQGGTDVAHLYDSAGDDLFIGRPTESVFQGATFINTARLFDYVHAYSVAGGRDKAELYGSDGDDEFVSWPDWARLSGPGYFIRVKKFAEVTVDTGGGNDTAVVNDSPGPDTLLATATEFRLSGSSTSIAYLYKLMGFEQIRARSHGGNNSKTVDPAALSYLLLQGQW